MNKTTEFEDFIRKTTIKEKTKKKREENKDEKDSRRKPVEEREKWVYDTGVDCSGGLRLQYMWKQA